MSDPHPEPVEGTAHQLTEIDPARPERAAEADPAVVGIQREVTRRLLGAPALSEAELRERGLDPAGPGLIRLPRQDGACQWPAFQFDQDGAVHPVVVEINQLLDATGDPWGVADWWLGENTWLAATPAELLGRGRDRDLLDAARQETSEL